MVEHPRVEHRTLVRGHFPAAGPHESRISSREEISLRTKAAHRSALAGKINPSVSQEGPGDARRTHAHTVGLREGGEPRSWPPLSASVMHGPSFPHRARRRAAICDPPRRSGQVTLSVIENKVAAPLEFKSARAACATTREKSIFRTKLPPQASA
jgi:hypothetical protein